MAANETSPKYQLTDELAHYCLPEGRQDPNRTLAWLNSVCLLFLLVGILGANQPTIRLKRPPPLQPEIVPVVMTPPPPPPEQQPEKVEPTAEPKAEAPSVVAVTLDSPSVNFSVPTIGNLVVPNGVAVAPPAEPMKPLAPLVQAPANIGNTGKGGDRPAPLYPDLAVQEHQEGSVTVLFSVDQNGRVTSARITKSSGHTLLDHSAFEAIQRWTMPRGATNQLYETTADFILQNRER